MMDLVSAFLVKIKVDLDLVVVLSEGVTHVSLELSYGEIQLKLVATIRQVSLEERVGKTANETALIILHHLVEVVFEELVLEVGKVKATIVIGSKLVRHVQHHLVGVSSCHECVSHGFSDFENLLIGRNQLVELQGSV